MSSYRTTYYVYILVAASFFNGLTGSSAVFIMGMFAYTADTTDHDRESRKLVYRLTEAAIFIPGIIGPACSGAMAYYTGTFIAPLAVVLALLAISLVWVFFIPESLPAGAGSRQAAFQPSIMETGRNITFLLKNPHTSALPWISAAFFLVFIGVVADISVSVYFLINRFSWESDAIGYYSSYGSVVHCISMIAMPPLVRCLSGVDLCLITWLQIGYACKALGWALFGLADSTQMLYLAQLPSLFVGPLMPYTRTIVSNSLGSADQATGFSGFAGIEGLAIFASNLVTLVYSLSVNDGMSWLVYQLLAVFALFGLLLVSFVRYDPSLRSSLPDQSEERSSLPVEVDDIGGCFLEQAVAYNRLNDTDELNDTAVSLGKRPSVVDATVASTRNPLYDYNTAQTSDMISSD